MNTGKISRDLARHNRLRAGKPKKLPVVEVDGLRDELKNIFTRSFPRTTYEIEFMKQTGFSTAALTEGFIERRDGGVEIVLNGIAEGDRPARIAFRLPYKGKPTLISELQVSPTGRGDDIVYRCSWSITCNLRLPSPAPKATRNASHRGPARLPHDKFAIDCRTS